MAKVASRLQQQSDVNGFGAQRDAGCCEYDIEGDLHRIDEKQTCDNTDTDVQHPKTEQQCSPVRLSARDFRAHSLSLIRSCLPYSSAFP